MKKIKQRQGSGFTCMILSMLLCAAYGTTYASDTMSPVSADPASQNQPATEPVSTEVATVDATPITMDLNASAQTGMLNDNGLSIEQDNSLAGLNETSSIKDPFEGFNRIMFDFNDHVDILILKPIARVYNAILPKPLNQGIHNVFLNIGNLPTIANDLLQFKFYQAANDIWRTIVNTTVGIGGLFDVGSRIGLMPYTNDFGMTLATYGYQHSNYLVLPFFGPNTIRDGISLPVDYYVFSIYPHIHPAWQRYSIYGLGVIDRRAQLLQFQSVLEEASLDEYVFVRNAYLQRRSYQIEENKHRGAYDQLAEKATTSEEIIEHNESS